MYEFLEVSDFFFLKYLQFVIILYVRILVLFDLRYKINRLT